MRCLIVGSAKTGTTALLYAVAEAIGGKPAIHVEERLDTLLPLPDHVVAKVIFEHETPAAIASAAELFDRRILLTRDPRDTLVSRLLYVVASRPALLDDLPYLRTFAAQLRHKQQFPQALSLRELAPMREPSSFLAGTLRHIAELAAFASTARRHWFVLRYEDLVQGRLEALSAYLGCRVRTDVAIDPAYARVSRTNASGDWSNWFTGEDETVLRPLLDPLLAALGYPADWRRTAPPAISSEASWRYLERLVQERRRHYAIGSPDPVLLPPPGNTVTRLPAITKGDIVNRLMRRCGFHSYLEFNKFDGASCFADVQCADKTIAYQPETVHMDALHARRMVQAAAQADLDDIVALPELVERCGARRFDVIFFDPVHVRPYVDHALRILPTLLNPGGVLLIHDCHPEREEMTTPERGAGAWTGETYKAFALLRHHNRTRALTVTEDYGVGLVWNRDLCLDYDIDMELDFTAFSRQRIGYAGLINYGNFLLGTEQGDLAHLFALSPPLATSGFRPWPGSQRADAAPVIECQLLWRDEAGLFDEQASAARRVRADGRLREVRIVLPEGTGDIAQLRFDFADGAHAVHIAAMALYDACGALMWSWDSHRTDEQDWRHTGFCKLGDTHYAIATNDDPQYLPSLPRTVLSRLGPGSVFQASVAVQSPMMRQALAELAAARTQLAALREHDAAPSASGD